MNNVEWKAEMVMRSLIVHDKPINWYAKPSKIKRVGEYYQGPMWMELLSPLFGFIIVLQGLWRIIKNAYKS